MYTFFFFFFINPWGYFIWKLIYDLHSSWCMRAPNFKHPLLQVKEKKKSWVCRSAGKQKWKLNLVSGVMSVSTKMMRGGVWIIWPTCRPGTCSRTGGSEWGRCSGSRSWAARTGTSGTTSCSPCRSRICGSLRFSSGAARSRCGATTPWSVRCGWPVCRGRRRRRTARRRPPERAPPPPPSPSPRSRGARCVRLNKLCLRPPWCAFTQGWLTVQRWTFSLTDSPSSPSPPPPPPLFPGSPIFPPNKCGSLTAERPLICQLSPLTVPPCARARARVCEVTATIIMSTACGGKVLPTTDANYW